MSRCTACTRCGIGILSVLAYVSTVEDRLGSDDLDLSARTADLRRSIWGPGEPYRCWEDGLAV
ncbi:hypothetical protein KY084_12320 [Stakelama sp. CBK3Z-3]|uniref:Uncharacterized protein n=1 Tax=Stakelama flava TaxID=2860338 RepID=A0ABS6XN60_9SPHN|nr:hypothetical protein [Stakelama flava]MBW4331655.1 hypothetical protein [Stakelama flava]